jgi:hypothetical protein
MPEELPFDTELERREYVRSQAVDAAVAAVAAVIRDHAYTPTERTYLQTAILGALIASVRMEAWG